MLLFEEDSELFLHHGGDRPFNVAQMCWFASGHYEVPDAALRLFERKVYPFTSVASCEMGDFAPDLPAASDEIRTYMRRDYAVGTSGKDWLNSIQAAPYFVTYKHKSDVLSYRDVGTVFTKFVLDDDAPGIASGKDHDAACEDDNLKSHATNLCVQSESTVLLLSHPHLSLGTPILTGTEAASIRRMSEMIIFPARFRTVDELIVGGIPRQEWSGECPVGDWIGCRRGRLLCAFLPLVYSAGLDAPSISLERIGRYEVIRSTLYDGPKRVFSRAELQGVCGGFIAEHASVDDSLSLASFLAELSSATVADYCYCTRRARYIRPALSTAAAVDIEVSWSPTAREARYIAVNGRVRENVRMAIDGVNEQSIPFFDGASSSVENAVLPFKPFAAAWGRKS